MAQVRGAHEKLVEFVGCAAGGVIGQSPQLHGLQPNIGALMTATKTQCKHRAEEATAVLFRAMSDVEVVPPPPSLPCRGEHGVANSASCPYPAHNKGPPRR